jgi:hypothetical protein
MSVKYIPKFSATLEDGKVKLTAHSRLKFDEYIASLKEGDRLYLTVGKLSDKKIRSVEANNYYWGVIVHILALEIGYDKEDMHEALRHKFLQWEGVEGIPTCVTTTKLSTDQFWQYCEMIRRWAATDLGIYIPDPNEIDLSDGPNSCPF